LKLIDSAIETLQAQRRGLLAELQKKVRNPDQ
jgi:hypothetical protein